MGSRSHSQEQSLMGMLLLLLMVAVVPSLCNNFTGTSGTTSHLKDIFLGRCFDYKIKYSNILPQVDEECDNLYSAFLKGFDYKPACSVKMANYEAFMEIATQPLPKDKAMFWSGVKELVHEYASMGARYYTLEDTLIGYLVDSLVWCGQSADPGVNYNRCPSWTDCSTEASESFWGAASVNFARAARGKVTVMMDASNPKRPAYRDNSFFGKYELPNLDKNLVTEVEVLLTHHLNSPSYETCTTGSMITLEGAVTSRGFTFSCSDDPDEILHLLCVTDPSDRACHLASKYMFTGVAKKDNPQLLINSKPNRF